MFADIDMLAILNSKRAKIYEQPTQHLNGHDPALILLYRYKLFKYLDAHNIWDRHEAIKKLGAAKGLTIKQKEQLEKAMNGLDEDLTRGMLQAEKKLAKNHRNTPFSLALIKARSKLGYWRLWQTEIRTKRDLSEPRATLIEEIQ